MFIDISTYVGHWPFRNLKYNTLEGLDVLAKKHGITHMVVANMNGLFYKNANAANIELSEELKAYRGDTVFLPMAIVNPCYPAWEKDARAMIEAGFAGFELAPQYHGYKLGPQFKVDSYFPEQVAAPVMALAEELDVPVRICACFDEFRSRSHLDVKGTVRGDEYYELLRDFPNVSVFCTGISPLGAGESFGQLIKVRKNIFFDMARIDSFTWNTPRHILNALDMSQLCYGSLSPFDYMEPSLINLEYCPLYEKDVIMTNPARAFKGLR